MSWFSFRKRGMKALAAEEKAVRSTPKCICLPYDVGMGFVRKDCPRYDDHLRGFPFWGAQNTGTREKT